MSKEKEPKKKRKSASVKVRADIKKNDLMREDLTNQLQNIGKFDSFFTDLVEDYIYFCNLKDALQRDIKQNGVRYQKMTGNGYEVDTPNESVRNLLSVNSQMLSILDKLGLQATESGEVEDDQL